MPGQWWNRIRGSVLDSFRKSSNPTVSVSITFGYTSFLQIIHPVISSWIRGSAEVTVGWSSISISKYGGRQSVPYSAQRTCDHITFCFNGDAIFALSAAGIAGKCGHRPGSRNIWIEFGIEERRCNGHRSVSRISRRGGSDR